MNKPKRQQSKVIQKLQQYRSATEFEKTKKQMMLAAKIQDAIKAKELNNTQFAEIMDQHPSVISKWVSGTHNFTTDTLFDIEEKLGICLVSVIDVHRPVIVKQYYSVVKNRNAVKWDGFHGKGVTKLNNDGNIIITATPLESHHHVGLPIFNYLKHEC